MVFWVACRDALRIILSCCLLRRDWLPSSQENRGKSRKSERSSRPCSRGRWVWLVVRWLLDAAMVSVPNCYESWPSAQQCHVKGLSFPQQYRRCTVDLTWTYTLSDFNFSLNTKYNGIRPLVVEDPAHRSCSIPKNNGPLSHARLRLVCVESPSATFD